MGKTTEHKQPKPLQFDCKGSNCHCHHSDKPETIYEYHCKCCIETAKALEEKEVKNNG